MTTQPPSHCASRAHSGSAYAHRVPIDLKGMTYIYTRNLELFFPLDLQRIISPTVMQCTLE